MDPRHLRTFLTLSESLHFGRASAASNISISTLSRNIGQLEKTLGTQLFVRDNRSVVLTEAGRMFANYARENLRQWDLVRQQLSEVDGQLQGSVSLYCSVTAVYSLLFDWLNELRLRHPDIEIKLHTGDPDHAIDRVSNGVDDMSITAHPNALPRHLEFKPITVSPLVFIVPTADNFPDDVPDKNLQALACITNAVAERENFVRQWTQVPFILPERGLSRTRLEAWFKQIGFAPKVYAQVAGNEAIVTMVSLGLGVGVVPKIVLSNSPVAERVKTLPVKPSLEPYHVGVIVQKKSLNNPLVSACWSLLK